MNTLWYWLTVGAAILRRQFTHPPYPEFPKRSDFGLKDWHET